MKTIIIIPKAKNNSRSSAHDETSNENEGSRSIKIVRTNCSLFSFSAENFEIRTNGKRQHRHSSPVSIGIDHLPVVRFPINSKVSIPSSSNCLVDESYVKLFLFIVDVRNYRDLNFTKACQRNDKSCNCTDYLSFSEPPYDENATETRLCGQTNVFTSKTRVVVIKYVYHASGYNAFNLTYETKSEYRTHRETPFYPK